MDAKTKSTLLTEGAKIGEPVPRAIVDTNTASVGIPPQPEFDAHEAIGAIRKQLDHLRQQVSELPTTLKDGARQAEATIKLYPISTMAGVAAVAAAIAFTIAGLPSTPKRSRYDVTFAELQDGFNRIRGRF